MIHAAFDWYQATIPTPASEVIAHFEGQAASLGLVARQDRPGKNNWQASARYLSGDGICHFEIQHGGNPGTQVRGSSFLAPATADHVRSHWPDHQVSRVDACIDLRGAGLFRNIKETTAAFVDTYYPAESDKKLKNKLIRDLVDDEAGETIYIGDKKKSPIFWRIYQKGYEQIATGATRILDQDTVRIEAEVHPGRSGSKADKQRFATVQPDDVFGAGRWSRMLIKDLVGLDPTPIKRAERESNVYLQKALYGIESYGNNFMKAALFELHQTCPGFLPTNESIIDEWLAIQRDHMRHRYPNKTPFDPGFEILRDVQNNPTHSMPKP